MKLSLIDRIQILNLKDLPQFGSILVLKLVKNFLEAVSFTEKELEEWEIKSDAEKGSITWNPSKTEDIDVVISPKMLQIIIEAMEKSENMPITILPLYDKLKEAEPKKE